MTDEKVEVAEQPKFEPGPVEVPVEAVLVEDEAPVAGSVEEVAKEVVAGHWGRGQARKRKLADAGWNPDEVLVEVDKLLHK